MKRLMEYLYPCTSSSPSSSSSRVVDHPPDPDQDSDPYYTPHCNKTHRHLVHLETHKKEARDTISVLSYNVLCDELKSYHGYCTLDILNWESRRHALLKEIVLYGADVLCLQEAQSNHIHNFWVPELGRYGYHHFHAVKKHSRSMGRNKDYFSDGCSIFYKRSKMKLVHSYKNNLRKTGEALSKKLTSASDEYKSKLKQDNLAIAGIFELQGSKIRFCVSTCHIHPTPKNLDVKLMQVSEIVRGLKRLNKLKLPIIFCGDFNTTPNEPSYQFLVNGHLDWFPELEDRSQVYHQLDLIHDLELSSAYSALVESNTADDEVLNQRTLMNQITQEPIFTTSVPWFKNTIDYIFYQKRYMTVAALLELVDLKKGEYLPNAIYPSDHIAVMGEFTFLSEHLSAEQWLNLPDYIWGPLADRESD